MIHLRLLGGVLLGRDGEAITGRAGQRHPLGLLALLATAPGGAMTRDKLLAYLWPDHTSRAARHRLSVALHVLRKELGKGSVLSRGDALVLDPSVVHADVRAFEEAIDRGDVAAAVELYRGPFLDGFFLPDVHEFDVWMETERERLARLQATALEQAAGQAAAAGDEAAASALWRRLGAHSPLSSRVAGEVADGLEELGDRTAALRHLRAHATRVARELGVDPGPGVAARIRRLEAPPEPTAPAVAPTSPPEGAADAEPPGYGEDPPGGASGAVGDHPEEVRHGDAVGVSAPTSKEPAPSRWRGLHGTPLAAGLVLLLALAALAWTGTLADGDGAGPPSLVPLPFTSGPEDPEAALVAEGLEDRVVETLAWVPGVERTGEGSLLLPDGARGRVGPSVELAGSVASGPGGLVVEAGLVRPGDAAPFWTTRYVARPGDPEAIREEASLALAEAVREELVPLEPRDHTGDQEAYDLYLEGLWAHYKRGRSDIWKALRYYQRAIERDTTFALAHATSADAYLGLARTDFQGTSAVELAREEARRSLQLDSTLAEGHVALGSIQLWYDWDFAAAGRSLRRAIVLDPTAPGARAIYAGYLLRIRDRPDAALRQWRKALELDPLNPSRSHAIERGLYFARRYEELLEQHAVTRSMSTDLEWKPGAPLANALRELGRFEEAEVAYREAGEWTGGPLHTGLGIVYARTGRQEEALAVARAYEEARPGRHHLPVAVVHAALGDLPRAMELLEEAYELRATSVLHFGVDPALDPLRSDPRFQDLLRRAGLPSDAGDVVQPAPGVEVAREDP